MTYQTTKSKRRPFAVKTIVHDYTDRHGNDWDFEAEVSISDSGEILSVDLIYVHGYSHDGDAIESTLAPIEAIQEVSGNLALEKLESYDFEYDEEEM